MSLSDVPFEGLRERLSSSKKLPTTISWESGSLDSREGAKPNWNREVLQYAYNYQSFCPGTGLMWVNIENSTGP